MGFFGLILKGDTPREVAIPEGFSLTLLMAALDLKTKQGTLMMQPNAEADAFIVCHLNASPGQAHANLMQELAPEDGPVMFWVEGPGKVHITGRWGYAEGEDEEEVGGLNQEGGLFKRLSNMHHRTEKENNKYNVDG